MSVLACKAIVGVAMSIAIAVAARETKSAWCLWSLFFVALVMAAQVD